MEEKFADIASICEDKGLKFLTLDMRYATCHNLTGHPLAGYKAPKAIATAEAALCFARALNMAESLGYGFVIFDAYRPQSAVNDFVQWSQQPENNATKQEFYPNVPKEQLFPLGYIALKSGHSRGSAIDLSLTKNGIPLDMGTGFDFMDEKSHHGATGILPGQEKNREILRHIMLASGFTDYENEWWHYRLSEEPFPDTYFDFDIV